MTCSDVRSTLLDGDLPTGRAADEHLAGCAPCRELVADSGRLGAALGSEPVPDLDFDSMYTSVKQEVERERGLRGFLRSRRTSTRVGLVVLLVGALTGFVLAFSPRSDLADASPLRMGAAMVGFGALVFGSLVVALRPVQKPALPSRTGRLLLAGGLAASVGFALAPILSGTPLFDSGNHFGGMAMKCFLWGSVLALPLLVLGWLLDRGGNVVGARALLAAAAAGLSGNLFLELHCSIGLPAHYLAGHVSVVVAMLGLGLGLSLLKR